MNLALLAYIPDLVRGIKEGADLIERLRSGDMTAEQEVLDWLGVTGKVDAAVFRGKLASGGGSLRGAAVLFMRPAVSSVRLAVCRVPP
jgi:hypothetical protein